MSIVELEKKLLSLERALSEAEGAIRRMHEFDNNLLTMLGRTNETLAEVRTEVANLKVQVATLSKKTPADAVTYR